MVPVHKNTQKYLEWRLFDIFAIRLGKDDDHEDDSCDYNDGDDEDDDDDKEQVMTGGTGLSCAHPDSII